MSPIPTELEEQLVAAETALHTATDVARALLTDHPHLPVSGLKIKGYSSGYEVHLNVPDAATVQAWADALSLGAPGLVPVTRTVDDPGYSGSPVFEHVVAKATVRGHDLNVWFCRLLPALEAAAWREARNDTTKDTKKGES